MRRIGYFAPRTGSNITEFITSAIYPLDIVEDTVIGVNNAAVSGSSVGNVVVPSFEESATVQPVTLVGATLNVVVISRDIQDDSVTVQPVTLVEATLTTV